MELMISVRSVSYTFFIPAQYVPVWVVLGVLSPFLVILMAVLLGLLTRSLRVGVLHAVLVLVWVGLFALASYFVTNDYVIWTPLALYILHAVVLVGLIVVQVVRRWRGGDPTR